MDRRDQDLTCASAGPTWSAAVARPTPSEARAQRARAALVSGAATRLVRLWGLVSLPALLQRVRVLKPEGLTHEAAGAVLGAVPGIVWLDDHAQWFSLPDLRSRLAIAVGKVFSITPRVPLPDLRRALVKALPGMEDAPAQVLVRYLTGVAGCAIDDGRRAPDVDTEPFVRATADTRRHRPSRRELSILRLLAADGGSLDVDSLRRAAQAASLPRTTVNQILASSPLLLLSARRRVRAIGDGQHAAHA